MWRDDALTTKPAQGSRARGEMPGAIAPPAMTAGVRLESRAVADLGLALVVAWGVVVATTAWEWPGLVIAGSWSAGLAAARHDLRTHHLPDGFTVLVGAAPVASVLIAAVAGSWRPGGAAVAGAAAMALPLIAVHLAAPPAMGFGDVKLAAALGLGLGLVGWRLALLGLMAGSAVAIVWAASQRRQSVPFGPSLVAGSAIAGGVAATCTLAGSPLLGWEGAWWR